MIGATKEVDCDTSETSSYCSDNQNMAELDKETVPGAQTEPPVLDEAVEM